MPHKNFFEDESEKNKFILFDLAKLVWRGIVFITSIRIEKQMMGGYRLTAYFNRKDEE